MLIINVNERISWENYFKHPFYNSNEDKIIQINQSNLPLFNLRCKEHSQELIGCCPVCKCNLCLICYNQHFSKFHRVLFFLKLVFLKKKLKKLMMLVKMLKTK